jgi:hypothetical protein
MRDKITLKGLQSQLNLVEGEIQVVKTQIKVKKDELQAKIKTAKSLQERIRQYCGEGEEPVVSEHALLRWVERVKGINLEEIKQEMLNPFVLNQINTLGGNGTVVGENFSLKMRNNTITTVTVNS